MRASPVLLLLLTGCIDRIELGFDAPVETQTALLRMPGGRVYALPAGEFDLVAARAPEQAVLLSQTIGELQLPRTFDDDGTAPRSVPRPDLGSFERAEVSEGRIVWREIEPAIRLPEFRPDECADVGCAAGNWDAEWCKLACSPPDPVAPAEPQVECDRCDQVRAGPVRCPPGQASFAAGTGCTPLSACAEDFPPGAAYVSPGASGGDGSRELPFATIDEAAAVSANIVLLEGTHQSAPPLSGVRIQGVCASSTRIAGSLLLSNVELANVSVEEDVEVEGNTLLRGVEIGRLLDVTEGTASLSSVLVHGDGSAALRIIGARTTGERVALEGTALCFRSELSLSDLTVEIAPGADASNGVAATESCRATISRAFVRGGYDGLLVDETATLEADDVELREQTSAAMFLQNSSTIRGARIYDAFTGIHFGAGTYVFSGLTVVRSGAAVTSISSMDRLGTASIQRAYFLDNGSGGLRLLDRVRVDASDIVVDESGLTQRRQSALEIDQTASATISRMRTVFAGCIDVEATERVMLQDLIVEAPQAPVAVWLHGRAVQLSRARLSGLVPDQTAITTGTDFFESTSSEVALRDVQLLGSGEGVAIRVASGDLTLRNFRISDFLVGLWTDIEPHSLDVLSGTIEGSTIGVEYAQPPAPRMFDTLFVGNSRELHAQGAE